MKIGVFQISTDSGFIRKDFQLQTPGDGEEQACCSPWGHKESDTT